MKTINLADINSNTHWIETKIKGENKYFETLRSSFTGKRFNMFGDTCISFKRENSVQMVCIDLVTARVKVWDKIKKENNYLKINF